MTSTPRPTLSTPALARPGGPGLPGRPRGPPGATDPRDTGAVPAPTASAPASVTAVKAARPEEIGGYRILSSLGRGGMGAVYRARDADGRVVALKLLHAHLDDPDARERLRREVAALQKVRHPGVARVLDAEIDSAEAFVVTELVQGRDLAKHVRRNGPLPPAELAELAASLRTALTVVHRAKVLHRDLTPGNVVMSPDGPVLIDFGVAQAVEDVRVTSTGLVTGTPGYVAPELLEGAQPSARTDWWGWAAVLAFAATGRPPFGKGGIRVVLTRVRAGEPDLEGLPERTADALRGALGPEPKRRTSPAAVVAALRAAAEESVAAEEAAAAEAAEDAENADDPDDGAADPPDDGEAAPADDVATVVVPAGAAAEGDADAEGDGDDGEEAPTVVVPVDGDEAEGAEDTDVDDTDAEDETDEDADVEGETDEDDEVPATRVLGARDGRTAVLPAAPDETEPDAEAEADEDLEPDEDLAPADEADWPAEEEWSGEELADAEEWPEDGEWVEDEDGWVPTAPPRRMGTVAALALPLVALGLAHPGPALLVAIGLAVLVRSVGLDAEALVRRRLRHGVRSGDTVGAVLIWPWYLVRAVLGVVPAVVVGGAVVAIVGGVIWWLTGAGHWVIVPPELGHSSGALDHNAPWVGRVAVGAMVALGLAMLWFGPMARATREGARWVLQGVAPGRRGALVVVAVALVVALVLAPAMVERTLEWWPLGGPPDLG